MSWKQTYVNRVSNAPFDLIKVKNLSGNIISNLNKLAEGKGVREIQFDDNQRIIFPDCLIEYSVVGNELVFQKLQRQTHEVIEEISVTDFGSYFVVSKGGHVLNDQKTSLERVIEFAFEYLLVQSINGKY